MESTHSVLLNLRNEFFTIKSKKFESAKIQFLYIGRVAVYACVYFFTLPLLFLPFLYVA